MSSTDEALRCLWRKCSDSGPYSSPRELYEHMTEAHSRLERGKGFHCKWTGCSRRFERTSAKGRAGRANHLIIHTTYRPHVCGQRGCGAAFNRKEQLKKHSARHARALAHDASSSDGEALPECKTCDKSFSRTSALKTHMHLAHYKQAGCRAKGAGAAAASEAQEGRPALEVEDWSDEEAFATMREDVEVADIDECEGASLQASELAVRKRLAELETEKAQLELLLRGKEGQ
ncbi:hypothetical protein AURDEDRAFT_125116 [Auricularia subglabra TFB-10046 SS5]|uniref:C2H2-type domain-containing protein n=1 Tax=Auricularia subglabra (strain TFB-10046 / SS5) TaxID=717982 RepID=J0WZ10_AURST|nr:hypothetical protein AURDEDRAFT_125116 [Auricularia subglabra TFB-10046 SS5]